MFHKSLHIPLEFLWVWDILSHRNSIGENVTKTQMDLLRGTLDMLVLKTLERGELHGYDIAKTIEVATGDALRVEEGSLYPALHRMQRRGWVSASWGRPDNNRRAKFYRLTPEGEEQLRAESAEWERYTRAVAAMMQAG